MIPRLIGITPGDGAPLLPRVAAAARGGLPALILREPGLDAADLGALAEELAAQIPTLILHLRTPGALELAIARGWGLHAPGGVDLRGLRRQIRGLLGASCHSADELRAAADGGCDYATISPVFPPRSKPLDARPALGLEGLAALVGGAGLPVVALGGIDVARAAGCLCAGAAGVAVIGALFGGEDAEAAARELARI